MYPHSLLSKPVPVFPLFGDTLTGAPHVFDFTSANPDTLAYDPADFDNFQSAIYRELAASGRNWGIGRYLEERCNILRKYPQMIAEGRVFHAGIDITASEGAKIFAPIDGIVESIGKETGLGNYGGFVIVRHEDEDEHFYTFYGHLDARHSVAVGQSIAAGQQFALIGGGQDSGGWFTHVHVQVITEKAKRERGFFQGYVSAADLPHMMDLYPDPSPLVRTS